VSSWNVKQNEAFLTPMFVAHAYLSHGVMLIFNIVYLEKGTELNVCLNQAQIMVIKMIHYINAKDHLIDPNNSRQTISILPIKVCNFLNLNHQLAYPAKKKSNTVVA
jgi:hypothetical protein